MPFCVKYIPAYKATAELLIVSEALKDTTVSDPDLPSIITSTEVLNRVISRLGMDTTPVALAKKIKTKLPVKSSILALTYKDTDGARAAGVANAIADEASVYFHEVATRGYSEVLIALNSRIAESQARIAAADRLLQRASAKNAFSSSDKALDDLSSQIDELRAQRGQYGSSLAADQATMSALHSQLLNIKPIVRGEILQKDVIYQQLYAELARDVADSVSEQSSFRDSFPGLDALRKRIDRERRRLKAFEAAAVQSGAGLSPSFTQTILDSERAAGTVAADRERLRATDAQLGAEQLHLQRVAGAGARVGTLRAERDAALQQYIGLTQRLSAAEGDAAQAASLGTLVVVSRAVPESNLSMWLCGLGASIVAIAIAAVYLVDALDRRFWEIRDIEDLYRRPVLNEVGVRQ